MPLATSYTIYNRCCEDALPGESCQHWKKGKKLRETKLMPVCLGNYAIFYCTLRAGRRQDKLPEKCFFWGELKNRKSITDILSNMFGDLSKANFVKILFGNATQFSEPKTTKVLVGSLYRNKSQPFCYSQKNQNGTIYCNILLNFRIRTIMMDPLTPQDGTWCTKIYEDDARARIFCRIARRSIAHSIWSLFTCH